MPRARKTINQINVVPYIDVMLVLLVIFMVTAPLVTPGVVELPSVSKAPVAPGIAEALIATAIGLFAAIPAVVAYNRYTHDVDRLAVRFETFIEEFSNILQRQG